MLQVIHIYLSSTFLFLRLVEAAQGDGEAQRDLLVPLPSHLGAVVARIGDAKVRLTHTHSQSTMRRIDLGEHMMADVCLVSADRLAILVRCLVCM